MKRLIGVLVMVLAVATALGSDLSKGYTFAPGERNVTHTKLNNLVDAATINTTFFSDKTATTAPVGTDTILLMTATPAWRKCTLSTLLFANTNIITLQDEDTSPAVGDYLLTYDVSAGALKKATLANLGSVVTNTADLVRVKAFSVTSGISLGGAGTYINTAHSLGGVPQLVRAVLVCTADDLSWTTGQELDCAGVTRGDGKAAFICGATSSTVQVTSASTSYYIPREDNGTITQLDATKWVVKVYAHKLN